MERILIISGSKVLLERVHKVLQREGFNIVTAPDPEKARLLRNK